jgi:hypothetical protein
VHYHQYARRSKLAFGGDPYNRSYRSIGLDLCHHTATSRRIVAIQSNGVLLQSLHSFAEIEIY